MTFALPFALSVPRCARVPALNARLPALCRVPLLVTVCPFRVTSLPCAVPPFVSSPAFTSRRPFAASRPLLDTLSPESAMSRPAFTCPWLLTVLPVRRISAAASARLWPSSTSCPPLSARLSPAETALPVDDSVPPLLSVARVSLPLRVFVRVISFPAATLSAPLPVTLPPRCVRLPPVDSVVSPWPVSVASESATPCPPATVSAPPCADTPPPLTVRVS